MNRQRQIIMLVDDNQANLNIGKNMLKNLYEVYALPSAERLFTFLKTVRPDLILLDIMMPGMNGFEVIKILKADARYMDIPVIFVTSKTEEMDELEGLALGAVDYVTKPFAAPIILKRIENYLLIEQQKAELKHFNNNLIEMVTEKTAQITGLQNSIISSLAELVEFRDLFTGGHIARTQRYLELLLNGLMEYNIYPEEVLAWDNTELIVASSQLHDLGKIFISDTILNKPGRLTDEEFETMKTHVQKGVEAIQGLRRLGNNDETTMFLQSAEVIAGTHHEKWDGSGYPAHLRGRDIPLLGRMMAIADVYDALISERPYKRPLPAEQAAKIIMEESGTHFDPVLVDVFRKVEKDFAAAATAERIRCKP